MCFIKIVAKKQRAIMVQATSSNAGKTLMCLCLCKIAKEMGVDVAPFKAQNMSNNTVVANGGEVSAAQWLQAISCDLVVNTNISPIVVKPKAGGTSQVLINGALEYNSFAYPGDVEFRTRARECVVYNFKKLSEAHELIIIEGAGASSEVNLRAYDISNMWLATTIGCDVVLVSDIERGGALASLIGTHCLLSANELQLIKGFVINKFSGKISLLKPGLETITSRTGWPCYGVMPWVADARSLPSEDSLWEKQSVVNSASICIIIDLPFFCNYNDYAPLSIELGLSVLYAKAPPSCVWDNVKFLIVPDTTSVVVGLQHIFNLGWSDYIKNAHRKGVLIVGVGAGILILSNCFVLSGSTFSGLKLLRANISVLNILPMQVVCACSVLNVNVKVGVNKLMFYSDVSADGARVLPLLTATGTDYGIYDGNIWGVCAQALFLNDPFRHLFLEMLNLRASGGSYLDKVNNAISKIAYKMAHNLSAKFLSLVRGN
ncbi:MAG: cobyric acid synthase [Candidatus Hodgkinia cicadicola]